MADRGHVQLQQHHFADKGPTTSQVLAVATLLPLGGFLLLLAALTLTGTLFGLAVTSPLFLLFSPVLLPAALVVFLAVAGFLTSGAFGITALSAFSWMVKYVRDMTGGAAASPGRLADQARGRARDGVGYVGQKTQDVGQTIQSKAHEEGRTHEGGRTAKTT